jgi:hypothetical protein
MNAVKRYHVDIRDQLRINGRLDFKELLQVVATEFRLAEELIREEY